MTVRKLNRIVSTYVLYIFLLNGNINIHRLIKHELVFYWVFQSENPVIEMVKIAGGRAADQKGFPIVRITPLTVFKIGRCCFVV